jgi:D-threo-aldose 1-dehydrogenase
MCVSKFIFGTGSLLRCGNARQRQNLLFQAAEAGFSHFDTAPYYGFGMAERELAPLLKARLELTVTTKVGLYSPGGEEQSPSSIIIRKLAGRIMPFLSRPERDFSVQRAQKALEASLSRLGRDVIDFYALHEPIMALMHTQEWQRWLEDKVKEGKIRHFGIAPGVRYLEAFLKAPSALTGLIQMQDSLQNREADLLQRYNRPYQITYGYVSHARKAGFKGGGREILLAALKRNIQGAIIVSTTKLAHLREYADLVEDVYHDP